MVDAITLDENSESIKYLCARDKRLAKAIRMIGPISYKLQSNSYAYLTREIIEQMLSMKAAMAIYKRMENLCGGSVTPKSVNALSNEQIQNIRISRSKVLYIRNLADAVESGEIEFDKLPGLSDDEIIKRLTKVRGIGTWTAKMYLIFVLDRQDILPYEDMAFLQGYGWIYKTKDFTSAAVSKKCKKWKPYASIAAPLYVCGLRFGTDQKRISFVQVNMQLDYYRLLKNFSILKNSFAEG